MKIKQILLFVVLSACSVPSMAQFFSPSPRREVRAVWMTTLGGLDWPHQKVRVPSDTLKQQKELCGILDKLAAAGFNTIILQTRVRATTIYPSAIEPWDGGLTWVPGKNPYYDPLKFAIQECHRRGMELHAWVVSFPLGKVSAMRSLGKAGVVSRFPQLCKRAGDDWIMDPGQPGTADYVARICAEITRNYDVDGIHLDYIRYPEHEIPFNDNATYRRYGRGENLAEWRRSNISRVVTAVHDAVKSLKPWVKLSCSPIGKYSDLPRYSSKGWNARDAVFQDAARWQQNGWMDFVVPMMYFKGDNFYPFALQWRDVSAGQPVVPGLGAYMLAPSEKNWDFEVIARELQFTRTENLGGQAYFRSRFVTDNVKGLYDYLKNYFYTTPALTQPLVSSEPLPETPRLHITESLDSVRLAWTTAERAYKYNIYQCLDEIKDLDSARLLRINYADSIVRLPSLSPQSRYALYAVTAVDRYGRESAPAYVSLRKQVVAPEIKYVCLPYVDAEYVLIEDAMGQGVATCKYREQLDVSHLPAGYYVVRSLGRKRYHRLLTFVK